MPKPIVILLYAAVLALFLVPDERDHGRWTSKADLQRMSVAAWKHLNLAP